MQGGMLHIKRKYQKPQLEDLGCGFFYCFDFNLQSLKLEVKTFLAELASYVFVLRIVLGICTTRETSFA